ncbi:MAG: serine/threonine-protein kinase PknK, partial [Lysobacteraceae bacterium]
MARGDAMSVGSPFGLLAQVIRRAAGVRQGEPVVLRQQKLRARLARYLEGMALDRVAEFLAEVVGAPVEDSIASVQLRAARQDAVLMGDQRRRAWEDWLAAECSHQPVLVVLEDLQWGDVPTVGFVDAALRNLREKPFMVLALARPEVHDLFPKLWADRRVQEIRLGELTRRPAEKLVRQTLGSSVPVATVQRIVELAAGNAFYMEELIRAVAEGQGDALPETVLAMVQARLESLDADARWILRAASVFGGAFWRGGVLSLLGGAQRTTEIDQWLAVLVDRELVSRRADSRFPAEEEFAFRHGLVREAAYAMLTDDDRILGHRLAAEWLERVGETDPAVLAEHYDRAHEPARAIGWYENAALGALEGNDFAAALARAERAIACGAAGAARGELRLLQAEAHRWSGEHGQAAALAEEALELLPSGAPLWFAAAGELGEACGKIGDIERLRRVTTTLAEHGAEGISGT